MLIGNSIYLDYQATTPLEPKVIEAMEIYNGELFANPHSAHFLGHQSAQAADMARSTVGSCIGGSAEEIIFTSGATESNNQAIASVLFANTPNRYKILISSIEHKCIKNAAYFFAHKLGYQVSEIPVDSTGLIDIDAYQSMLNEQVLFVSIMAVNNEIGVIQPIQKLVELAHNFGAIFHCDAAQAPEAIDIDVKQWNVDMLSLSAHKLYGPKGIGALYIRNSLQASLPPFIHGGGQQFGLRSGTLPTGLSVGFAKAMQLCREGAERNRTWLSTMRQRFLDGLRNEDIDYRLNGTTDNIHPGSLNIRFANVNATNLLAAMQPEICASTGSACNSEYPQASHVLTAMGLTEKQATSSLRFSFGRFTDAGQIDRAIEIIHKQLLISKR